MFYSLIHLQPRYSWLTYYAVRSFSYSVEFLKLSDTSAAPKLKGREMMRKCPRYITNDNNPCLHTADYLNQVCSVNQKLEDVLQQALLSLRDWTTSKPDHDKQPLR